VTSPIAGSASRGTAMSITNISRHLRCFATFLNSCLVRIGSRAPVELITISAPTRSCSSSSHGLATASISSASRCAFSGDRLVTTISWAPDV